MASVALEEYELLGDPKYRSFVTAVDKALKTFEYSSEWADLISALGKLNKVLVNHIKFPVVPRRITISKRLAQCLHPALPSGVHLKALETYDIIFKCIGTARLSQELFIYSAGLFPLLGHAAMSVRPVLLTIYESHFVPLGERLRPGLLGFLIGVLPGLEEGSDHFERTDTLLQCVSEGVEKSFFYGCLWRCILSNPGVRLPAITFLLLHLDKKKSMEDQLHLIGTDIDAMVQGMCAALQDSSVLVQRCALDLLLLGFSLHDSQLVQSDRVRILEAAITVVLRRDMSLNRRLFSWLLGTEATSCSDVPIDNANSQASNRRYSYHQEEEDNRLSEPVSPVQSGIYFETYSKDLLLIALRNHFAGLPCVMKGSSNISGFPVLWPYRILISLLDRSEIGMHILDDILIEVFRSLYKEVCFGNNTDLKCPSSRKLKSSSTKLPSITLKGSDLQKEVVKTANLLFATLEPAYLWEYVGRVFRKACVEAEIQDTQWHLSGKRRAQEKVGSLPNYTEAPELPSVQELCQLIAFLLDVISVETYQDTPTIHLPELLSTLAGLTTKYCTVLTASEFLFTFHLCSKILSKVQPSMSSSYSESMHSRSKSLTSLDSTVLNSFPNSYKSSDKSEASLLHAKSISDQLCWFTVDPEEGGFKADLQDDDLYQPSHSVLTKAVEVFQGFLATFISEKLLTMNETLNKTFQKTLILFDIDSKREKELNDLLCNCIVRHSGSSIRESSDCNSEINEASVDRETVVKLRSVEDEEMAEAFEAACQFLIELAAFPVYVTNRRNTYTNRILFKLDKNPELILPDWLKLLLLVGCLLSKRRLHLCAISALLELVALTHSAITTETTNPLSSGAVHFGEERNDTVTCVLTVPMITQPQLAFLTHRTKFFHLTASRLWSHVGVAPPTAQLRSVELLQQIHNLSPQHPCHGTACDVTICKALSTKNADERMEGSRKFCSLWHLTRDVRAKFQGGASVFRLFDRPLFLMLDLLGNSPEPQKTIADGWLNHCLQRGDLARVLQPLLLILLHRDTARVSIQHVNIYCPKRGSQEDLTTSSEEDLAQRAESQIYAISSVGGNVIYHVSGSSSNGSHSNSKHGSPDRKILALTSLSNEEDRQTSKVVTSHAYFPDYELPCSHERLVQQPISVFINPFGSMTSLSSGGENHPENRMIPDLTNVRRFDLKMLKKNYFDELDSEESDDSEKKHRAHSPLVTVTEAKETIVEEGKLEQSLEVESDDNPSSVEDFVKELVEDIITTARETTAGENPESEDIENSNEVDEVFQSKNDLIEDLGSALDSNLLSSSPVIHPLHAYLLIYTQVYDSQKVLYALSSLKAILLANPRQALWSMATTSISQQATAGFNSQDLQVLLARHRKSIFGNNFEGLVPSEATTTYRSSMFVEVIVTTCLYYVRGVYPNLPKQQQWLTQDEVLGNQRVRLLALEVLTFVFAELVGIVKDSGRSFASYLSDLLARCKVQKILLHCLTAGVFHQTLEGRLDEPVSFSQLIINYNEQTSQGDGKSFEDTLEVGILRLISKVIMLEDTISWLTPSTSVPTGETRDGRSSSLSTGSGSHKQDTRVPTEKSQNSRGGANRHNTFTVKYQLGLPVPSQPMFLTSVLTALRQIHRSHLHSHWLSLVLTTLPFTGGNGGRSLSRLVVSVVSQLCLSLDVLTDVKSISADDFKRPPREFPDSWPPDYLITLVEGLTTVCHFCLLDSPAAVANAVNSNGGVGATSYTLAARTAFAQLSSSNSYSSGTNATQIISNLLHVFSPTDIINKDLSWGPDGLTGVASSGGALEALLSVRRTLLSNLPRILASLSVLWRLLNEPEERSNPLKSAPFCKAEAHRWRDLDDDMKAKQNERQLFLQTMGSPKVVKQHVLSFLSPLSVHYGSHFMAAVAVVWQDFKSPKVKGRNGVRKIFPSWSHEQQQLVALVSAIKVLPLESVVQTVRQVLRQPPPTSCDENQKRVPLEVSLLEFFLAYIQTSSGSGLVESWPSLLALWREGLQLSGVSSVGGASTSGPPPNNGPVSLPSASALPIVQLHLLALLHEFVQKAPMMEDKRDQRDLQEVAQKLVDACTVIAGSSLEQTNWLRRNLAVRPGPQPQLCDDDETDTAENENTTIEGHVKLERVTQNLQPLPSSSAISTNAQYSVQALQCLAEFLAPIMDVVYVSEEKEKVVSLLNNIMFYVTPYLKNHSVHNTPSFRACSQLLASISGYQYTRKAWKKDAFDLLLDPSFFQMEGRECLSFWRSIVDHLMTHDKTTFRDFLARVYTPQTGSLNLFSSKEQEYEQRSYLLKRLAFVIFCSETDQYQKYMPDIQERLAECLRLPQVPSIQAQVFLCFRVLLLRMSPDHITSLWPIIITEMVQVFLQMEQELSTETEQFSSHLQRLSLLDSSWVVHSGNGLHAHNHPAWLQLYLSACKLLDLVVCLPANMLPQFQMYRWAFVGDSPPVSSNDLSEDPKRENLRQQNPRLVDQDFVPHIARLAALMNQRASCDRSSPQILVNSCKSPLLRTNTIKSLLELQIFFNTLANCSSNTLVQRGNNVSEIRVTENDNTGLQNTLSAVERGLESDFVEPQGSR